MTRQESEVIEVSGTLTRYDVMLALPNVGTLICANNIAVPDALESNQIYSTKLYIFIDSKNLSYRTDIRVEPEQTNAVGERIDRKFWIVIPDNIPSGSMGGASISLLIAAKKKEESEIFHRFKSAMSSMSGSN